MNNSTCTPQKRAQGSLFVIAAPSGAGKTSVLNAVHQKNPKLRRVITTTTRPMRANEVDGQDYYFLSRKAFEQKIAEGAFAEHAVVFGNLYGTTHAAMREAFQDDIPATSILDVQGAASLKQTFPEVQTVFILPPSARELRRRLSGRGSEAEDASQIRLNESRKEIACAEIFDFIMVNDDFDTAVTELESIIFRGQARYSREHMLATLVPSFL